MEQVHRLNVGVIFGGRSGEHDVSLMSARSVLSVIDPTRYAVYQIGITRQGEWFTGTDVLTALESGQMSGLEPAVFLPVPGNPTLYALRGETLQAVARLDVVFPVLHGTFGEDGTLQGLLELADVAYVGAGVLASSVGMDKALFKDVMRANGLPVVPSLTFSRSQIEQNMTGVLEQVEAFGVYPFFVKPANLGSSVGITKCRNRSDLYEGLMEAARFDRRVLVEHAVPNAREIEVSVLGNDAPVASQPGEIRPGDDFYSYNAKYYNDHSELIIPARLSPETAERIRELALRAYIAIDGAGMARVDFLMDERSGDLFLSEVNTIPGFTRISMYPKLWNAAGVTYQELIDQLIQLALGRKAERDATERQYRRGE